jgi:hypothetical protein
MDPMISIRLECDADDRDTVSRTVRGVLQITGCTVQSETEETGAEHGMIELGPVLVWLATTASGLTATVLGAMIYDAIRASRRAETPEAEDKSELRVTRRSVEIIDPRSGARLTFHEETTKSTGHRQ